VDQPARKMSTLVKKELALGTSLAWSVLVEGPFKLNAT